MEIKIQSTQIIKPSNPTPESQRNFKLSLLDHLAASSNIDLILYFHPNGEVNASEKCNQLVESLSQSLSLFYPLAGRLTQDELEIDCNDQGVRYLETQVTTTLHHFLQQGPKTDHIRQLVSTPKQSPTWLVTIQVNVFLCGALAVGVSATHKVTDTWNLVRFINAWATTNQKNNNADYYPSFDNLGSIFPPREWEIASSNNNSPRFSNDLEPIVNKRFVFNRAAISNLRAKAGSRSRRYSRVTLVSSLIWKAIIAIDKSKCGNLRKCLLAPAMNLRGKVGSPISKSSFGNIWAPYAIRFSENELKFVDLANVVEDTTRGVVKWVAKASGEEICTHVMACYVEVEEELKENKFCRFTSWCNFPIYEVDFGWGKPFWASVGWSLIEMVILMDDKCGDGVEAWVSLKEEDMKLFEQDEDILAFTS